MPVKKSPSKMNNIIKKFSIKGLHNRTNVELSIEENRLILIGNNGQGKTTIINLLYFVLSRQWRRLLKYEFQEIKLQFEKDQLILRRDDLELNLPARHRLLRAFTRLVPPSVRARMERRPELLEALLQNRSDFHARNMFAVELGISLQMVERLLKDSLNITYDPQGRLFDESNSVHEQDGLLRSCFDAKVIYLPTYRRIERDLKTIFPELEEEVRRFRGTVTNDGHVELVEFGMEDVENKVKHSIGLLKDATRTQFNSLAGSYLRDVVRDRAHDFDEEAIRGLSDLDVKRIVERVEEHTLEIEDKTRLTNVINRIRTNSKITTNDRFVAHYFAKLHDIHLALSKLEKSIREFAKICSAYLTGKRMRFDDSKLSIQIIHDDESHVPLSQLSSGEKQIVSLFAHLYLNPPEKFAIIIDEPELSLSVEWQKTLLPDIWKSGQCALMVAATHSPFIFENELDPFAKELTSHQSSS
jgi:ABC-type lipoprotein export system ATPase subunit